ncbi:DUF58 domain-containing protein [Paracoccus sp. (in: a-proteobacteria)]|uniref:DUF58 domain-containing protein n=1 Tax=Paracoccus sp. TaxID=267 RepID=UPI0026E0464F|nr:DUF58 domain-containing protein [Paracoccus sp. (in: a-proteobacteria)]MDO5647400.1 DUF58 domain-containing protein [Paracoccus sp. (in: a-proteobacteria)]
MTPAPADLRARAEAVSAALPGLMLSATRLAAMVAPGAHGLRRAGVGDDFWQYRPAHAGDSARNIDWRRSARSDAEYVRDRQAQTAQSAMIWVSAGQGMGFASPGAVTKRDRAQVIALALGLLLLRGGERVGLLDQAARSGRAQADSLAQSLLAAPVASGDDDAPPRHALRPHQRVVLIGDFLAEPDWLPSFLAQAAGMGATGVLLQILDAAEADFPFVGAVEFHSASGAARHDSRDAAGLRAAYLERLAQRQAWLADHAGRAAWAFHSHRTDHAAGDALAWLWRAMGG